MLTIPLYCTPNRSKIYLGDIAISLILYTATLGEYISTLQYILLLLYDITPVELRQCSYLVAFMRVKKKRRV